MRQLLAQVPRGQGEAALRIAAKHDGMNLAQFEAASDGEPLDVVIIYVPNSKVEELLDELQQEFPSLRVTLVPRGVITLRPPPEEAPEQVTNVEFRSALEIFLAGLQSVGSWKGFLAYAATAGVVVWIGFITNTIYLLVAAMLLAPFAGPAMTAAIATARGDSTLLWRSLARYAAALATTIAACALLTLLFRQETATSLMIATSHISSVALLLPLAAGAAGAIHLAQSERSSLVSGAAVGMLVAASLAPPAGLVGMAVALGRWEMATNGLFLLALQLAGINLSGALLFRLFGLSARGARYERGKRWLFPFALAVTVLALGGLLALQFARSPNLERSTQEHRISEEIERVLRASEAAHLVEAEVRFTGPQIPGQNTLLGIIYAQRRTGVSAPAEEIEARLRRDIIARLRERGFNVTPLIKVTLLNPPEH